MKVGERVDDLSQSGDVPVRMLLRAVDANVRHVSDELGVLSLVAALDVAPLEAGAPITIHGANADSRCLQGQGTRATCQPTPTARAQAGSTAHADQHGSLHIPNIVVSWCDDDGNE